MRKLGFLILAIGLFAGCAHLRFMPYTATVYEPTKNVDVLRTRPPDREYVEIGEVSVSLNIATRNKAVLMLAEKARQAGADALVLLGEKDSGAVILEGQVVITEKLVGIAIRYK